MGVGILLRQLHFLCIGCSLGNIVSYYCGKTKVVLERNAGVLLVFFVFVIECHCVNVVMRDSSVDLFDNVVADANILYRIDFYYSYEIWRWSHA